MRVGIPTETKNNEYRVAITPAGTAELTRRGHEVLIQAGAGAGSAIADSDFKAAGAQLMDTAEQVWAGSELLLKVKEPMRCWLRAPPRSPTRPCRPLTAHCRCWRR
jgi:alanine dehydrogenase